MTNNKLYGISIDDLPINIAIYNINENEIYFVDINTTSEKTEKIKSEEVRGKKLLDVFPAAKDYGIYDVMLKVFNSGKSEQFNLKFYEDGRISGWRSNKIVRLPNKDIMAIYEDLTEQKRLEEAIIKEKNILEQTQEISHLGSWEWDAKNKTMTWSNEMFRIFGEIPQSFTPSFKKLMDYFESDELTFVQNDIKNSIKNKVNYSAELKIKRKDGSIRYIKVKTNLYSKNNKEVTIIGSVYDFTEQAKLLLQIENINKSLEDKVEVRTNELSVTNEELLQTIDYLEETREVLVKTEKMAALGSLVAGVAHEINTPIGNGLMGATYFSELSEKLKKDYYNNNLSEKEFTDFIETTQTISKSITLSLKKAATLINSFKQVAVDQTNEEKRKFNLNDYVNDILISLHNKINKYNIKIETSISENINIESYAGGISQILTNLITNSLIHGYDKKDSGLITIKSTLHDDILQIIYTDDGNGMSEDILSKMYDPFFTNNRANGGTGLGMHIVYNLVSVLFKGSISCHSSQNNGVHFTIQLHVTPL